MEPGTFEDDEDRRTKRTVIGAELTGRVNGLRVLIMRGRGCADCEKACDRKRRDGRTAHPNCLGHACNLASKAGVEAATACTCGLGSRCAISRHSAARSLHSLEVIIGYSPNRTHQSTTSDRRWLMAKKPREGRRKLVEFDRESAAAVEMSARGAAVCD